MQMWKASLSCVTDSFTWAGGTFCRAFLQLWANELQGCGVSHDFLRLGALSLRTRGSTGTQDYDFPVGPWNHGTSVFFSPCDVRQLELIYHTFGRQNIQKTTVNLDLFLRRFNETQFWVITEVCLCSQLSKRVQLLKKFIKIAAQ